MIRLEVIEEMTRRLVEFYRPVRIYLFGSEARGEAGPDSDLDFLVVVRDDTPEPVMRTSAGYSRLSGLGMPKDVIPWRQSDFEARAAYVRASLPATVVREGRLLYESEEPIGPDTAAKLDAARAEGGRPVSLEEVKRRYGL
ncbi:MAG: nucleotidyltransferase domain-containing protein [Bryobacteraceae bacterium]|jgi:predicted nucleotidyltransferase